MAEEREEYQVLKNTPPFDVLSEMDFKFALENMQAMYLSKESREEIIQSGRSLLYLVRSGTYDLVTQDDRRLERLEQGDLFGFPSLLSGRKVTNRIDVVVDGIVWTWPEQTFHALRQRSQAFERYFLDAHSRRLLSEHRPDQANDWTVKALADVVTREPVKVSADTTIREAARLMSEQRVSSLLITEGHALRGIITDRDLRNRVVAAGLDTSVSVAAIMTPMPAVVYAHQSLFDALTIMGQSNIHHLPVVDSNEAPVGVITVTDLMRQQRSEPVVLINALFKAPTREALIQEAKQIPDYLRTFAGRVRDIGTLGRLLASLTDGLTRKLISLYEQDHGRAPCAYVWLAFGSQARQDQTPGSDQDNGLLLADDASEAAREWFMHMATYVCEGLGECGVRLCPGDVMAMNPKWNKTRLEWREQFQKWVRSPTPEAILHSMIFFDSRLISGHHGLYRQHREQVAELAKNDMFLGNIARHIGTLNVPLGLFNRLRTTADDQGDYIDVKKQAIAVLNDIVRLYSLAHGLTVAAIPERLAQLKNSKLLAARDNQNLLEAWQFLTHLRLNAQLYRTSEKLPANAIDPERLSTLQRRQLKAAFRVIKEAQQGVSLKFGRNL
ncbi:DUF294 nucleotidyltransferase-like domain-containing protein [Aliidiomarina celeris]|uniref:DUF294 nucleotidyltransferase-like domain-containing protein n=1 Tax=Aliidiomarina celeris TaxID=2249428 RepID=UPI000DE9551A|nr:DUF294 nucleotidyltransferase-like domain-containing protein [Aliidiomarina celeris]